MKSYLSIFRIVLHGKSSGKILLATLFSFTFSIAVILCTFGLMDGFDHLLKSGLRHSSGDLLITSRRGFFFLDNDLQQAISRSNPLAVAPVIQTEAFALHEGKSRGVLVRGIENENFSQATGLNISVPSESVVIGEELSKQLNAPVGSEIALTLARGNESSESLPSVKLLKVSGTVKHGIYQKDLRFVYLNKSDLSSLLGVGDRVNLVILATEPVDQPLISLEPVRAAQATLRHNLSSDFYAKPFWSEYAFLIEAVKVEKFSISLILQLIVVVAVFNIMAFVIYIMEKKAQDFFFLRAVGLSLKSLMNFWLISILMIWFLSCIGAHLLSLLFDWSLHNLPFLQIPGEIYVLSSLSIKLDLRAYLTVYSVSLIWVLFAGLVGYWRLRSRPIIQGLRQEFSA